MSIQSSLGSYATGSGPGTADIPDPPDDSELRSEIAPNWAFPFFDVNAVKGIDSLRKRIRDAVCAADPIEDGKA
jgi:hypothetical protein